MLNFIKELLRSTAIKALEKSLQSIQPPSIFPSPAPAPSVSQDIACVAAEPEAKPSPAPDEGSLEHYLLALNPNKDHITGILLTSVYNEVKLRHSVDGIPSPNASLLKILMPVAAKAWERISIKHLIAVQPITSPVAQVHTLRVHDLLSEDSVISLNGEGSLTSKISIQVIKEVVEVSTKKLSCRWAMAASTENLTEVEKKNLEDEIIAAMACEIAAEFDQEILNNLRSESQQFVLNLDDISQTVDNGEQIANAIAKAGEFLATKNRRGGPNWCVVSPAMLTILQISDTDHFIRKPDEDRAKDNGDLKLVGTINQSIEVYVDQYQAGYDILIGYKGAGEIDSTTFFCPYVLLTSCGVIIDPATFEPVVTFMTRYGFISKSPKTYFGNIKVTATRGMSHRSL